jgi:hypothetical protein
MKKCWNKTKYKSMYSPVLLGSYRYELKIQVNGCPGQHIETLQLVCAQQSPWDQFNRNPPVEYHPSLFLSGSLPPSLRVPPCPGRAALAAPSLSQSLPVRDSDRARTSGPEVTVTVRVSARCSEAPSRSTRPCGPPGQDPADSARAVTRRRSAWCRKPVDFSRLVVRRRAVSVVKP